MKKSSNCERLAITFKALDNLKLLIDRFKSTLLSQNTAVKLKELRDIVIELKSNEELIFNSNANDLKLIQERYYTFMSSKDIVTFNEAVERLNTYIRDTIDIQLNTLRLDVVNVNENL